MKFSIFLLLCIACITSPITVPAQTGSRTGAPQGSLNEGTIDSQFIYLNRISRSREGFKLIRPANLQIVRENVADSLRDARVKIEEANQRNDVLLRSNAEMRDSLVQAREELAELEHSLDTLPFLGMDVQRSTYHTVVWSVILLLVILVLILSVRMRSDRVVARSAKQNLEELQAEIDLQRKKSLEKEQRLKRQLQDEINKRNG